MIEDENNFVDFKSFASHCCVMCKQEDYCPTYCDLLEKAEKMPFEKIQRKYEEYQGDLQKVARYIKQYRF